MKMKTLFLTVAFCLCTLAASFAANPNVGSWKLNEEKSKIAEGSPRNTTVVYTADGDNLKCVVEGVDGTGAATHNEWTGKFDGKDYAVTGDPTSDTRAVKMVDENHYKLTSKKAGKVTMTGTVETSADGKSRTLIINAKDAKGKKVSNTLLYDKQE